MLLAKATTIVLTGAAVLGATLTTAPASSASSASSAPATAARAAECGVRADARLYCGNKGGARGYEHRSYGSLIRGTLNTTFSWFQCWGHGDPHSGGNDIWYWTQLDNGQWGNVPAVDVQTTVDPAPGLREC
ncbi:hypothetical protein ABZ297_16795 [Nonomuraea sp. NPDC005983]|uniref:hypothetical protein n=1 Tax=Nonomuraea sp. NPDC005983 TaxID=3155595 RepID=UPI0033A7A96F